MDYRIGPGDFFQTHPAMADILYRDVIELAGAKVRRLEKEWDQSKGTPVFTRRGKYTSRGWTEWWRPDPASRAREKRSR